MYTINTKGQHQLVGAYVYLPGNRVGTVFANVGHTLYVWGPECGVVKILDIDLVSHQVGNDMAIEEAWWLAISWAQYRGIPIAGEAGTLAAISVLDQYAKVYGWSLGQVVGI